MESQSFSAPENLKSNEKIGLVTKILSAGAFSFLAATPAHSGTIDTVVPMHDTHQQEQVQKGIRMPDVLRGGNLEFISGKLFVMMPEALAFLQKEGGTYKNGVITIWGETFDVPDAKNGSVNAGTFISTTESMDKSNPNKGIMVLVLGKTVDSVNPTKTKSMTTVHNIYKQDGIIHIEVTCY